MNGAYLGFSLAILCSSIVDDGEGDSVASLGAILQLLSLASSLDRTIGGGRPALHGIGAIGPRGVHFLHGRPSYRKPKSIKAMTVSAEILNCLKKEIA